MSHDPNHNSGYQQGMCQDCYDAGIHDGQQVLLNMMEANGVDQFTIAWVMGLPVYQGGER